MKREDCIAELRRQWATVADIHVPPSSQNLSEEEEGEIDEFLDELDREEAAGRMLLRDDLAYVSLDNEGVAMPPPERTDDSDLHTRRLQQEAYTNLCLRLVFVDAMDVAMELLGTLTDELEPSPDVVMQLGVGKQVVHWLARYGYADRAWAFVEQQLFHHNGAANLAIEVIVALPIVYGADNLARARSVLNQEASHWWDHPEFGHALQTNALHMWLRLWNAGKNPEDLAHARTMCQELHPSNAVRGLGMLAKATWEEHDLLQAIRAIENIPEQQARAEAADGLMDAMMLQVHQSQGSRAFEFVVRQVADRLKNKRWRDALLQRLSDALRPHRSN